MSSLALLEVEIPSPLYVTGKNYVMLFWALMVAIAFLLCMDVVEVMVVIIMHFFQQEVGIG